MTQEERNDLLCAADIELKKHQVELLKAQIRKTNAEAAKIEGK